MITALDANILLRLAEVDHPQCRLAELAVDNLYGLGFPVLLPQSLYEFHTAATRPLQVNGLGFSPDRSFEELQKFRANFPLADDVPDIYPMWEKLIEEYQVKGKNAHDARIVAAMRVHGIQGLCTFNIEDFRRYDGIVLIDPAALPS